MEKKNKDAIKIPFEKSPKIGITTNYAIKGAGNSFARTEVGARATPVLQQGVHSGA